MGQNDTAEQLAACQADALRLEQTIARIAKIAEERLRSEHASVSDATHWVDVRQIAQDAAYGRPQGITLGPEDASTVAFLVGAWEGASGKPAHGRVLRLWTLIQDP